MVLCGGGSVDRSDSVGEVARSRVRLTLEKHQESPLEDLLDAVLEVCPPHFPGQAVTVIGVRSLASSGKPRRAAARALAPIPESAVIARWFLDDLLTSWGVESATRDDALLLADELVSNATRHARAAITVSVVGDADRLRVTVIDDDRRIPVLGTPAQEDTSGRGLLLVDVLADRWGVDSMVAEVGKAVWFELAWPTQLVPSGTC